jgi:hypothetical protein
MNPSEPDASLADAERCPQCGAVGTTRWNRADGVPVCDECWLEMGPPVLPKPQLRFRRRYFRRRRIIRKDRNL